MERETGTASKPRLPLALDAVHLQASYAAKGMGSLHWPPHDGFLLPKLFIPAASSLSMLR